MTTMNAVPYVIYGNKILPLQFFHACKPAPTFRRDTQRDDNLEQDSLFPHERSRSKESFR